MYDLLSSEEHIRKYFEEYWCPNIVPHTTDFHCMDKNDLLLCFAKKKKFTGLEEQEGE